MRWAVLATVAALAACSSAQEGPKPFKASSGASGAPGAPDDDDDSVEKPDAAVVTPVEDGGKPPAGEQASSFRGILGATPATRFGVAPHCTYEATMKNVEIELAITPSGSVIAGTAKNNYVEAVVGTCELKALGTLAQTFTLATATGDQVTLLGTGGPKTKLVVKLTKAGASWEAGATWERTDRTDDLKWVVKSNLTLGPK